MFKRSRKRIILSIMGSLVLLFSVTLAVILLASFREVRQRNADMLANYAATYTPDRKPDPEIPAEPKPGRINPPMEQRPDYQLSTFYAVAILDDGTVLATDNGGKNLYSEEELISLAKQIRNRNRQSGRTGDLTYIVSKKNGYTLVAFMDNTVSEGGLKTLLHNVLIIGGISLVLLFFISLYLSRRIIRPLEENDRQQKQFISDASHELKTPVAVITANAEMLSREVGESEWLGNIRYESERMGELVGQLLDLSRAENAEDLKDEVDFSRLVTGETLAFESLAFEKGRTLKSSIEDGVTVTGSRSRLQQMVSVLLDNAVRYSTGGEIEVTLNRHGHTAQLSVANEGEEIPPEKQAHLFDRFYRVDEARNSEDRHYGLGLSIAKAVAEKHGGSIGVSCRDGIVRFTVSIPEKKV